MKLRCTIENKALKFNAIKSLLHTQQNDHKRKPRKFQIWMQSFGAVAHCLKESVLVGPLRKIQGPKSRQDQTRLKNNTKKVIISLNCKTVKEGMVWGDHVGVEQGLFLKYWRSSLTSFSSGVGMDHLVTHC